MKSFERNRNAASSFGLRTISSLQGPVYRLYFFGTLGLFASLCMQTVVGSMLIFRLTGSSALLGTMSLVNALPMIVTSIFGGAIADRIQKKYIMFIGLLCTALIVFCIGLALHTGLLSRANDTWWLLLISSFCMGVVMGLLMPAVTAIIPELVARELSTNAVALNNLGMNIMSLVAPGVAGLLIDKLDFKSVYFTMAGLYLFAAVTIFFLPRTGRLTASAGNILFDIQKGFRYIRKDLTVLLILAFTLLVVILSMPFQQLLPIFVDNILKVGATGMGVLMSVAGAGALAGSFVIAALPNRRRGLMLLVGGLISGVALVIFSFSASWGLSLAFMVFAGLGQSIRSTIGGALVQSYTQPPYMGRVMSILMMQWGFMSLCTFFAGLVAEVIPVQWVVGGLAILLIVISLLTLLFVPRIRKLD